MRMGNRGRWLGAGRSLIFAIGALLAAGCGPSGSDGADAAAGTGGAGIGGGGGSAAPDAGGTGGAGRDGGDGGGVDGALARFDQVLPAWCERACAGVAAVACGNAPAGCAGTCKDLYATLRNSACRSSVVIYVLCSYDDPDTTVYMCDAGSPIPKSSACEGDRAALGVCQAMAQK